MLKNHFLLYVGLMTLVISPTLAQSFLSFNIRYDNPEDGVHNWHERKTDVVDLLTYYQIDLIGLQEALQHQAHYLDSALTHYKFVGVGRADGKAKGEFSPIFYDARTWTPIESGTFWLSETPERVSIGWDAALERICTYGLFDNGQQKIWVFNTHFDHRGGQAREESALLILDRIKDINQEGYPVIFMGDLNSEPGSLTIQHILYQFPDPADIHFYGPKGTFSGFDERPVEARIDYIFARGIEVLSYRHIDDKRPNGLPVSDHLPVLLIAK